jgi:hypothetical protein
MSKKRSFVFLTTSLTVFLFAGVSVNAAGVSVMVIESGVPKQAAASAWENGLMDVLFEAGHVASNARNLVFPEGWEASGAITVSTQESSEFIPREAAVDLQEAGENGMDYFLLVLLDYVASPQNTTNPAKPKTVTLKLFRTNPVKFITSENYRWSSKAGARADYYNAGRAMRLIIPFMGDQI